MSEEQIIEKIKKGDKQLYEQIVRKYNQRLYRVARAIIRNESDIEDVIQDTYLKAYLALAKFENRSQFSTWITRILINNANERLRKRDRETTVDNFVEMQEKFESSSEKESPHFTVSNNELKKVLEEAIDSLPENLRTVYMLREVEGMSVAETSECLGLSEENVKTRLHRAKAFLKDELYRRTQGDIDVFRFGFERCDQMVVRVMLQLDRIN